MGQEYKGANCVCHDDYKAAYAAEKLMLDKGCKKPAFIGVTEQDKAAGQARKDGFSMPFLITASTLKSLICRRLNLKWTQATKGL